MCNKNEKGVANAEQSKEQPRNNVLITQDYYTPKHTKMQANKILSLIGSGQANAIHLSELIKLTGFENRLVRKEIERLRRSGYVIVSDNHGYYYPETAHELSRYIKRTERQAKSIFYTLRSAKRQYRELENSNQLRLPFDELTELEKGEY